MDEIALSAPPAQRDDGHGSHNNGHGGQRRCGDASTTVVIPSPATTTDCYDAGICVRETIVVSYSENGGVGSLKVIGV